MEEENKKVTRRKFIEDSSKKALAGTAAAFLGLGMIKPKAARAAGCWFGCVFGCSSACGGCTGTCEGGCTGSCSSSCTSDCAGACTGSCDSACLAGCDSGCLAACLAGCDVGCDSGCVVTSGYSAQSEHDTPVSEREVSTRHVTA